MANGYFERGEVYWLRLDGGVGSEMGIGRPCVIVSGPELNTTNDCVIVAYTTKQGHRTPYHIPTYATGIRTYVVCHQLYTYDKSRLQKFAGVLTPEELRQVDDVLEKVFDLGYVDDTAIKAKESEIADLNVLIGDLKNENAGFQAEIGKRDDEIAALKMEIEMWQKCYGRCMDMLVDVKVAGDLQRRTTVVEPPKVAEPVVGKAANLIPDLKPETQKQPESPKVEEPVAEAQEERLDINSCTATALKKIGFSLAMARKIVESRPFSSVEDIKRVNGLKSSMFKIVEPKLCCVSVKPVEEPPVVEPKVEEQEPDPGFEKLNVNTATAVELHEIAGIPKTTAYSITGYRKKNGPFGSIDDLLKVRNVFPGTIAKCRHLLEV